jgi:hypothetical protein
LNRNISDVEEQVTINDQRFFGVKKIREDYNTQDILENSQRRRIKIAEQIQHN